MIRFEVGMKFTEGYTYVVEGRTAKTVTVTEYAHFGRSNQKAQATKKLRIQDWGDREYALFGNHMELDPKYI